MEERGALVILDRRTVLIAADAVDITASMIARIDDEVGDGTDEDTGPGPDAAAGESQPPAADAAGGSAASSGEPEGGGQGAVPGETTVPPAGPPSASPSPPARIDRSDNAPVGRDSGDTAASGAPTPALY